jgi:DNA-binding IclR family transcriptional regulator
MNVGSVKNNKSVGKMLTIMETMARANGAMKLKEIGHAVAVPPSTVLRFLGTLMDHGYARQDEKTLCYSLTMKICELGSLVSGHLRLQDVARPFLLELSERCGESSCLAIEQDLSAVYVDVVDGPDHTLRALQRIGKSAPLHSTGVGKCLLLGFDEKKIDAMIGHKGLNALTPATITSRAALLKELDRVRRDGYAMDREECESGVQCIAAPVIGMDGAIVAAVSVSGPKNRVPAEKAAEIAGYVVEAARGISSRLGAQGQSAAQPRG